MPTILVIEDDDQQRELLRALLEWEGYTVHMAENGQIGLNRARDLMPDMIVCDSQMPQLNGDDVFRALCGDPQTKCIPFLFLCEQSDTGGFLNRVNAAGHNAGLGEMFLATYRTKPFQTWDLLSAIRKQLSSKP